MTWMSDAQAIASLILSLWGIIALVMGPYLFFKARNFFPERKEAISPDQLRKELGDFDFKLREAFTAEIGRLRLSSDEHHRELLENIREAQIKADQAREVSLEAKHKADLVEERVTALDRLVIEKLQHIQTLMKQGGNS